MNKTPKIYFQQSTHILRQYYGHFLLDVYVLYLNEFLKSRRLINSTHYLNTILAFINYPNHLILEMLGQISHLQNFTCLHPFIYQGILIQNQFLDLYQSYLLTLFLLPFYQLGLFILISYQFYSLSPINFARNFPPNLSSLYLN